MTRTKGEQKKRHNVVSTERVGLLGASLVAVGMAGFYFLPGMISDDATGSKFINAFYCSVITLTTIGFGDICPANPNFVGRVFLTVFPIVGLGFFCGPILDLASSWKSQFPGGTLTLVTFTLGIGISMLTVLEGLEITEALHLCVVLGTTIGYGDITPTSDLGRLMIAIYAILMLNVMGSLLDTGRQSLEYICTTTTSTEAPTEEPTTQKEDGSSNIKKKDE